MDDFPPLERLVPSARVEYTTSRPDGFRTFFPYVCAAFLCHFSETLRAKGDEDVGRGVREERDVAVPRRSSGREEAPPATLLGAPLP